MADAGDWNKQVVAEFRENGGKVAAFDGPLLLLHHRGRKSGREFVAPIMYLGDETHPDTTYVFASKAGAPTHPDWYYNLTASGEATVEIGTETVPVSVKEVTGSDRDRIFAEQVQRFPGFGGYEEKTAGVRTIPVLALKRRA